MSVIASYRQKLKSFARNFTDFDKAVLLIIIVIAFYLFMLAFGSKFADTPPFLSVAFSWIWFLLPGYLLSFVVAEKVSWWERIPISFVLSIGLATPFTITAILLHFTLDEFISLHVTILLASAIILLVKRRRTKKIQDRALSEQYTLPGRIIKKITPLLIIAVIMSGVLIVLAREWPLYGDEIAGLSIFTEVIQQEQITGTEPFHGTGVPVTPRNELIVWTYDAVLVDYVSGTFPTEFFVNSRPILVALAMLSLGTLLHEIFKEKYQALFIYCIWCIYLLTTMQGDGTGSDFITRIIQDKFLGWFVVIPIVLVIMLWFMKDSNKSNFIGFVIVLFGASMVHPITLTQAMILTGGFGLIYFLYDRSRQTLFNLILIGFTLIICTAIPFYQYLRFSGYSPVQIAGLGDAVEFGQLSSSLSRYRLWMLGNGRYILHPSIILKPIIIVAYVLLPWIIFQARKSYAARLIVGAMLILLVLLYTPPFAALAGKVVTPYLIWRLAWPFPLLAVLIVGWVLWAFVNKVSNWSKLENKIPQLRNIVFPAVILVMFVFSTPSIFAGLKNYNERRAAINLSKCVTAKNALTYLRDVSSTEPVNVLASHDLNFCIPGYAALANVVEFRGYGTVNRLSDDNIEESLIRVEDVNYFNVARYIDDLTLNSIVRHDIDYILIEKERLEFDFQLRYLPEYFQSVYEDEVYSLYAVRKPVASSSIIEANTALRSNQFEVAISKFDKILQEEPTNILAFYGLGLAQASSGHNDLSIRAFEQAVQYAPNEAILYAQLASSYIQGDDITNAIKMFQEATNLSPSSYTLFVNLGQTYILVGQLEEAYASFVKAASLHTVKGTAAYYSELGRLYQSVNMISESIRYYESSIAIEENTLYYIYLARAKTLSGDLGGAIDVYNEVISLDRWSYLPHLDLGYLYKEQGFIDEAIKELEIACQLKPTNVSAFILLGQAIKEKSGLETALNRLEEMKRVSNVLPGPYRAKATLLLENGEYDRALEELNHSSDIQPRSVAIQVAKGYVSVAKGQTDVALDDFNQALLYHPDLISARLGLSLLYYYESDFELATDQSIQIVRISPFTAWSHLNLAQSYQQEGYWGRARNEIDLAIQLEPRNVQGYISSGELYKAQFQYNQAIIDYQKALEIEPRNSTALLGIGEIYQDMASFSEAENIYKLAAEADPNSVYPLIKLMDIYWQQERFDEANALEDEVVRLASNSKIALIKLADLYKMQGRIEEAKLIFEHVINMDPYEVAAFSVIAQLLAEEDNDQSVLLALYNNMLSVNPESAEAYLAAGQFYVEQGQMEEAEQIFQEALNFPDVTVDNFISLSELQQKQGDFQIALSTLKKAKELYPNNAVVYVKLGDFYQNAGEVSQAEVYYNRATNLDPGGASAYVGLSQLELIKRDYYPAEKILQDAANTYPGSVQILLALANFQESIGKIDQAETNLVKATEMVPSDIKVQRVLGDFYMRQKRNAEALKIYQEAFELSESNMDILLAMGDLYLAENSPQNAIELYQKAGQINRSNVRPYLSLANLYQSTDEWDEALKTLYAADTIGPANVEVKIALGELHRMLGRNDDAIKYLEQASNIDRSQITSLVSLAEISRDNGDLEQAINYLKQAVEIAPTNSVAYTALSKMYLLGENPSQAEAILSLGIQKAIDKEEIYLTRAALYESHGQWEQALEDYRKAGELLPLSTSVGLELVNFYVRRNDLGYALESLSQLEKRKGINAEINVAYGNIYSLQTKWTEASQAYHQAIDLDSTIMGGYLGLARISEIQGDVEEAIRIYELAIDNVRQKNQVFINLGKALQSQTRYVEAYAAFQNAANLETNEPTSLLNLEELNNVMDKPEIELMAEIRNALKTPNAKSFRIISQTYQYRGEWGSALSWLQKAVNLEPYNSDTLMMLGDYYRAIGQWSMALETYKYVLRYSSAPFDLLLAKGSVEAELMLKEDAQESFRQAIEIKPASIDGYLALAKFHFDLGEYEPALEVTNEGIAQVPGDYRGYQMLGDIYAISNPDNFVKAEKAYNLGLQVVPGTPELYARIADLYTAQLLAGRRQLDAIQAIELLAKNRLEHLTGLQATGLSRKQDRVTEMKIEQALLIYNSYLAKSKSEAYEFEQANEYFDIATRNYMAALTLRPNYGLALVGLGKLELAKGSLEGAVEYFEQAVAVDPHSTLALSYLGSIYLDFNRPEDAINIFEQIIDYDPSNLFAQVGLSNAYRALPAISLSQAAESVQHSQFKLQSLVDRLRIANH